MPEILCLAALHRTGHLPVSYVAGSIVHWSDSDNLDMHMASGVYMASLPPGKKKPAGLFLSYGLPDFTVMNIKECLQVSFSVLLPKSTKYKTSTELPNHILPNSIFSKWV